MTQYLTTLTLDELGDLTGEELAEMGITEPITVCGHAPVFITNVEDYDSIYFALNSEDYS